MPSALPCCLVPIESLIRASRSRVSSPISSTSISLTHNDKEMIQAPNCSSQRDEDMKLSLTHTRHETRERHQASKQASKQATSNKKQQEPIDEGTKNSTSLPPCAARVPATQRHSTPTSHEHSRECLANNKPPIHTSKLKRGSSPSPPTPTVAAFSSSSAAK